MEGKTAGAWLNEFDERQQKAIDFARLYNAQYSHGEPGHLHLTIIGKLAALLDAHDGITIDFAINREMSNQEL